MTKILGGRKMIKRRNYEMCKVSTGETEVMDKTFAKPIMYRLQYLYDRTFRENRGSIMSIKINKFAHFIGKIFDIKVPKIRIMKRKKIEKIFKEKGILGICIMEENNCKEIWLEKELVKSGNGELIYNVLVHELRHCWQGKNYNYYYGEKEDSKELQELREADAYAFTELIFYYLFEKKHPTFIPEELSAQITEVKDEIRTGLWKQIQRYYFWHGDVRTFGKIKKLEREVYSKIAEKGIEF